MSLFNMLFQMNPAAPEILGLLGIDIKSVGREDSPVGRFRDVYLSEAGDKIFIFTRNGYSSFDDLTENFQKNNPYFVRDWTDDFDRTFRTYEFNTPPENLEYAKQLADMTDTTPSMVKFKKLLQDMESGADNEQVAHAKEVGRKIFAGLKKSFDFGEDSTLEQDGGSVNIFSIKKPE